MIDFSSCFFSVDSGPYSLVSVDVYWGELGFLQ